MILFAFFAAQIDPIGAKVKCKIVNVYRHFVMIDKDEQKGQKVVL
ncbi:MAG: hypothetical protein WBW41_16990 [Verrucomicrobiia bacterium]